MKFWAVILSLYFSVLAVKPCVDDQPEIARAHAEMTADSGEHEHASDMCSPFCSCACCGVQMLRQDFAFSFTIKTPVAFFQKPSSTYQSRLQSDYCGSIWQPPQIA